MHGPEEMAPVLGTSEDETVMGLDRSPFEHLRRRRQQIANIKYLDLDIPGYGGELVARYKLLNWDHVRRIAKKHENSREKRKLLYAQVDLLIEACDGFYRRVDGGEELAPLDPERTIRYDKALAEGMGFSEEESESARKVCLALFVNDLALVDHHGDLLNWMRGSQEDVDAELVGESEGPRQ